MPIRQAPTSGYAGSITATAPSSGVTLDRGIAYGGGDSSTFFQDLEDQDRREALQDEAERKSAQLAAAASAEGGFDQTEIDAVTALLDAGLVSVDDVAAEFGIPVDFVQAAYDANKPLGGTQSAYDAVLEASAITDTTNEFLEDIAAANQAVIDAQTAPVNPNLSYQDAIDEKLTNISNAKTEADFVAATALNSGLVDQKDIEETFGPTFAETVLEGVSDVLGAGTGALANVAGSIPVVGGALKDTVEGVADFLKETKGTLTVNPITGAVQGTWGDIPPWVEKQTITQIGNIPGSQTTAGVTTGTIFDDIISIGRGEQDIGDVLEGRTGQVASTIGIDPAIIAAAAAAGKTVKDYLADKAKAATLAPEEDTTTETEVKPVAVDLSGGPDIVEEVLGQQGVEAVTGEEAIDPTSPNQVLIVGDGADAVDMLLGGDKWKDTGAGGYEEVISERQIGDGFTFEPPIVEEEPPIIEEEPPIIEEEPEEEPVIPEVPEAIQGYRAVQTKPGGVVDIDYLYDIAGPSIFAPRMEEEDEYNPLGMYSPYAEGGIVQDYDIEELIRFLENQRG